MKPSEIERPKNICPGCRERVRREVVEKNGCCPACGKLIQLDDLL